MSNSVRSRILNFLSEPRCLKEVAEHLGVPTSVARRHIKGAIEQDQILACEYPGNSGMNPSDKHRLHGTVFYISKDSGILSTGSPKFSVVGAAKMHGVPNVTTFVKFHPKTSKYRLFSLDSATTHEESELIETSYPKTRSSKEKLIEGSQRRGLMSARPLRQSQFRVLSTEERLATLKALSMQPLSYLELHGRLNVTRQATKTLTKNGLIKEIWGPRDIGVRYRLTGKGEQYLKRLDAASRFGKDTTREASIRLKHRSF